MDSRSHSRDVASIRLLVAVVGVLATLVVLGLGGAVAIGRYVEHRQVVARMGPAPPIVSLPEWEFALSGPRALDLKVSLEIAPDADPAFADDHLDRIGDRLYDAVRAYDATGLTGEGSAERIKESVEAAVRRETGRDVVRRVLIERMVVK